MNRRMVKGPWGPGGPDTRVQDDPVDPEGSWMRPRLSGDAAVVIVLLSKNRSFSEPPNGDHNLVWRP